MDFQHIIWPLLILIFIALPVIQMMPSPKQKLRAKLRETAMQSGLLVQFAKIPSPDKADKFSKIEEEAGIAYRWQRPPEDKRIFKTHTSYRVQLQHEPADYRWFNPKLAPAAATHEALGKIFLGFPQDVAVIESTPIQISAFWRERGEVEDVKLIAECLQAIHAIELDAINAKN